MKRSLLARLRTNGALYLIGAVLLGLGVPLYQVFVLEPSGFSSALSGQAQGTASTDIGQSTYLVWIHEHNGLFLVYHGLLILAFALILTLPFSLYRIIVAQEILGQDEDVVNDLADDSEVGEDAVANVEEDEVEKDEVEEGEVEDAKESEDAPATDDGMLTNAWRGKGFIVLAAWLGTLGLLIYVLGSIVSTFYLVIASAHVTTGKDVADNVILLSGIFTATTNTGGIGLLGLGILLFGATIGRVGMRLWPGIWVALGYVAILVGGLLCSGAIAAGTNAGGGQVLLNTVGTLLFALWTFWLGLMLIRLQPE